MSEFVDSVYINVKAGSGGNGAMSFRREAHVPQGGPDGGDGGKGGSIWIQADRNIVSLYAYRDHPHIKASNGTHGAGKKMHGKKGEDKVVRVPEGTIVSYKDGEIIADLVNDGDKVLVALGGRSGRGNARFLSNQRRAPSFAEKGEPGEEFWISLEVRLMADAALVGFPNAGKSTLISSISSVKAKIADYPFTTLVPNLGVVRLDEHEFVLADIPGLIEGASQGKGLGFQFLKHIERAMVLVILVDLAPSDDISPKEQEEKLIYELGQYNPELLERPRMVVGSKADVATQDFDGIKISAVTRTGLDEFVGQLGSMVNKAKAENEQSESYIVHMPAPSGFSISREDDGSYRISGKTIERVVAMTDITNEDALDYVHQKMNRMGVEKAMKKFGILDGDIVHIGELEFEYKDEGF
ncbi:MAG: GTPase ObgE [Acidimicrobiia bacterium]